MFITWVEQGRIVDDNTQFQKISIANYLLKTLRWEDFCCESERISEKLSKSKNNNYWVIFLVESLKQESMLCCKIYKLNAAQ